jgi:hypothetical protein
MYRSKKRRSFRSQKYGSKKAPELSLPEIRIKKSAGAFAPRNTDQKKRRSFRSQKYGSKKTPELSLPEIRIKKNAGAFAPAQVAWVEQPLRD